MCMHGRGRARECASACEIEGRRGKEGGKHTTPGGRAQRVENRHGAVIEGFGSSTTVSECVHEYAACVYLCEQIRIHVPTHTCVYTRI